MDRSQAHALTRSLADLRSDVLAIIRAGIRAVDAERLVARDLDGRLDLWRAVGHDGRLRMIAAGKAAPAMAFAADRRLGSRIVDGLVVAPSGAARSADRFATIVGGHPVPDEGSERAGRAALAIADAVRDDELLLVLISGGASSLVAVPAVGLTLEEKRHTTATLLRAGADIHALNTVRKHVSAIKGGRLAVRARGRVVTLAISDVVGDDLSVIASGPTVPDTSTFADALDVLRRFGGGSAYPQGIVTYVERGVRGEVEDTPKPGDPRLASAVASVIGGRRDAMEGAAGEAEARGYAVALIDAPIVGEARIAGPAHLRTALERASTLGSPACIVSSGETTVHVTGDGRGGRNQELALASAAVLQTLPTPACFGSAGTDGVDGPTDAAGALVDPTTVDRARAAGLAPDAFLARNDAYPFFARLGDLIHTGPTGTNVGDLQVFVIS